MTWTILSMIAAVLCYTVSQLQHHGKLRWMDEKKPYSFWGEKSDTRKYKYDTGKKSPAFFLSTTLLVFITDGYHLSQAGFKIFLALSFVPITGWMWAGVIWLTWGIFFTIFYRLLSR